MGLFDALSELAYEVKMDRIISHADREMAKWDEVLGRERVAAKAANDARKESLWREADVILQNTATDTERKVLFHWDGEVTEEMREQVSSFVENMQECVDDFLRRMKEYESDEELYDSHNLACPESVEYGSDEFDYPTKAKAKIACKRAVESLIKDVKESYEGEKEQILSYARDYYSGMADMFDEFVGMFLESYDDYMSLECEGDAEKYISAQKPVFFNERVLREQMRQYDLKARFTELVNERFDVPAQKFFDGKQYFSLCTYDEDEGDYCYCMDEACDKIYQEMDSFLETEIDVFLDEVFKEYAAAIIAYCNMLKGCLEKLLV